MTCIVCKEGLAVSDESLGDELMLSCIYRTGECSCHSRSKPADEAESSGDDIGWKSSSAELLEVVFFFDYSVQSIESEQRHEYLEHSKRH